MRERHEPGVMKRRDEHAGRDSHGLAHVVVLGLGTVIHQLVALREDHDEPRCTLQKRFMLVRSKMLQSLDPLLRSLARIEGAFLDFRLVANPLLHGRIADYDEPPRLPIRAVGRSPGREQTVLDHVAGHGPVREFTNRASSSHLAEERPGFLTHLFDGEFTIGIERNELGTWHGCGSSAQRLSAACS